MTAPWKVYALAALAEEDEPFRKTGEWLWDERKGAMQEIQTSDPLLWDAGCQQHPTIGGGVWFQTGWLNFYPEPLDPRLLNIYLVVDPSLARTAKSDFTTIWAFATGEDRNFYWLDLVEERLDPNDRAHELFRMHRKWRPCKVGYEEYGLQTDIRELQERMTREGYRFPIQELGRTGEWHNLSKADRIRSLVPIAKTGRLWLPDPNAQLIPPPTRELVARFLDHQWSRYPAVEYDDILDVMSRLNDPSLGVTFPVPHSHGDVEAAGYPPGTSWMVS